MTIFAVICAGLFPLIHMGRPWLAWWMLPYPNAMSLWPNFKSPLIWDVFAVSTYFTVSLLFWGIGLIPDMATFRDKAEHPLVKKLDGSVHFHDLAHILFDQALLAEGGLPEDPAAYVKRVNALLV